MVMMSTSAPRYRETLTPAPWIFLATALVMPASLLVFLPISIPAGIAVALGLYAAIVGVLIATTPRIEVTESHVRAGRARLPLEVVSNVSTSTGREAFEERGVKLDARAWMLLRGWIPGLVRVELDDPQDPTPYWLVSSRRPEELAAAINAARGSRAS